MAKTVSTTAAQSAPSANIDRPAVSTGPPPLNTSEAGRDRFELQRDVGNEPDHGDDGDERGEAGAFAEAGADQVGDRGDAVGLADPEDLADQDRAEAEGERRAEIDRQEIETRLRGRPTPPLKVHELQ